MCEDTGIVLACLPPYFPDLNPIECSFAQLKAWIKKNHAMINNFADFEDFLHFAVEILSKKVKVHFNSCQIGRTASRDDDDMDSDFEDDNED